MRKWFSRLRSAPARPLTGTPIRRRQKTYSAGSGYVYEYFYEGYRVSSRSGGLGAEHVFQVSPDRTNWFPVTVFLDDDAVGAWEREHERDLDGTERYAVVKLALFQAFDDRPSPPAMREEVRVRPVDVARFLEKLDLA